MTLESERSSLRDLIGDALALRAGEELGQFQLPSEAERAKFRSVTSDSAEKVLGNYERALAVDVLAAAVIDRLRDDISRRSRVSGIIEIAINISAVLLGLLGGAIGVFLDPNNNASSIKIIALAIAGIAIIQFIGNWYLKQFDHNR
ncbi:hypothetical protein [Novosphingobium percolationis]|uniref:hypothetical protein n=1 Tax=Novosphingobium percolationis TaxID=2871811 RepID=UPI001CD43169|nr:hypothetical protein [Novosphingobium percolationis]